MTWSGQLLNANLGLLIRHHCSVGVENKQQLLVTMWHLKYDIIMIPEKCYDLMNNSSNILTNNQTNIKLLNQSKYQEKLQSALR